MTTRHGSTRRMAVPALALAALLAAPAGAQEAPPGCEVTALTDPDRLAYTCEMGIVIEAEAATAMGFTVPGEGVPPAGAVLEDGAALIEVPDGAPFQIRTPHAVASVRGTLYTVDVTGEMTSVFVSEGTVAVRALEGDTAPVLLGAGDGADVTADGQIVTSRWAETRARALLERFGR